MSDSWFDYRVRSIVCGSREAQVLKDYLRNRIDVNETSRIITSKIVNDDNPGYLLECYWQLLQDILTDIPPARPKVVTLLE